MNEYLNGRSSELIAEFVEVESSKRDDRPQLIAALEEGRRQKATLVIAKLDRLARNVAFIAKLMEAGVSFLAVDNPHANKLMLHLLAAFAEHERDQIRARTKAALAAAKAHGVVLGRYAREVLSKQNHAQAMERARVLADVVLELRSRELTIQQMTDAMNAGKIPTANGGRWHVPTVHRLVKRVESIVQGGELKP